MERYFYLFFAAIVLTAAEGCYTRFAAMESAGVTAQSDSVRTFNAERETCVWERDLTGYPVLRCYPSYYPRQWYVNNLSPWWYHSNRHLYNADRCPPYYYYDPNCGCCRYYLNDPHRAPPAGGPVQSNESRTQDSNRVNISASSSASIRIPLQGTPASPTSVFRRPADRPSGATAEAGEDSLAVEQGNDSLKAAQEQAAPIPQDTVGVIRVNRLRRSIRGR